jgi:hypothetical protein
MKKIMKNRLDKNYSIIQESANQISKEKQYIKYDTRDYVVGYLVEQFKADEFYVPESYQRKFIWTEHNKCFFIESVLMGLPIPFMFFSDTPDGRIEIVDGAQRTQTLVQFVQNDLELNGLEVLTKSNGFTFTELDPSVQRRFLNTNIRVVYLEQGTTETTRQEIFKRINVSGIKVKPAEIRRGAYIGKFKDFLEECAENKLFKQLAPRSEKSENRYEGLELASRFFAYSHGYPDFPKYRGNVMGYIDAYVIAQNKAVESNPKILIECKKDFDSMLDYAHHALGDRGFRKTPNSKSTPRARFEALAIGIIAALKENSSLPVRDVSGWIDSEEFYNVTSSDAANNRNKLIGRINFVKQKLLEGAYE